jgi:uncharacterized protein (TIGR00369 family)
MSLLEDVGADLTGLEKLRALMTADRRPEFGSTLGIRLVDAGDGWAALDATPGGHLDNVNGSVHGGFTATMLDFACGYAVLSKLTASQTCATLELKVAYHKAITHETGPIRADGRVVSIGRRAAFSEGRVTDTAGTLLASATSTYLVIPLGSHSPRSKRQHAAHGGPSVPDDGA